MKNKRLLASVFSLMAVVSLSACSVKPTPRPVQKTATGQVIAKKTDGKQCVDNFELLKKLNYDSFLKFRNEFDVVNHSYDYYKSNEVLMENDPREQMTLTLNDKLNMICDRVKSETFNEIRKKMKTVSTI
ncbi:hypothetical protein QNN88_10270 [Citrobacter sp. ANG330]|uniref:hypothetical protein n=1 Tax=Citrobacter sp. ANG330 TaxID=3048142 RepID=UPI0039C1EDFA